MKWHSRFTGDNPRESGLYIALCFKDGSYVPCGEIPLHVHLVFYHPVSSWDEEAGKRMVYYWQEID